MPRTAPRTAWKPGQSGNPRGRPKQALQVAELARMHTKAALEALAKSLADPKTRVNAAAVLLERGWGKPLQPIEHSGELNITGGIDAPAIPETVEEWLARRRLELAEMGTTTRTTN